MSESYFLDSSKHWSQFDKIMLNASSHTAVHLLENMIPVFLRRITENCFGMKVPCCIPILEAAPFHTSSNTYKDVCVKNMMTSSNGNCPFVMGIHRSPLDSPHKGQWRGASMFSLVWAWTNGGANNRDACDFRWKIPQSCKKTTANLCINRD